MPDATAAAEAPTASDATAAPAKSGRGAVIAVVAVVVVVALAAGGYFLFFNKKPTLSGTLTVPEACDSAASGLTVTIAANFGKEVLGSGPATPTTKGETCVFSFSFDLSKKEDITVMLKVSAGGQSIDAQGPAIAAEDLGEPVALTPESFPELSGGGEGTAAASADDSQTQSDLRNAMAVALTFYTDDATFDGITAGSAASLEPSVTFNEGPTVPGEVSLRLLKGDQVLLVSQSASGTFYCYGKDVAADTEGYGTVDAQTLEECAEPSW